MLKCIGKFNVATEGTRQLKGKNVEHMWKKAESGRKKHEERERLPRWVVAIEILWSFVAVGCGDSGRDVMLDGGVGREVFRKPHRVVWWVEVLGRQGWRRGRIFLADDREFA